LSELDKKVYEHERKCNIMEQCLDYFQEIKSTNHSFFSLFDR